MATATVTLVVPNITSVLLNFNQMKVYRSDTGATGVFSEITGPGTRLVLETGKTIYEFVDTTAPTDATNTYYTSTFFHSATLLESSQGDPVQGEGDPALDVISVDELKEIFLFGVDLTDDNGTDFPDTLFEFYIKAAVSWIERRVDIPLRPLVIADERHDFYRQDYYKYIRLQTQEYPILDVDTVKLVLPTEQEVISFDKEWLQIQKWSGQIEIIPGRGQLSVIVLGQTGAWLPLIYGWTDYIPDVFRIAYTAGFERGQVPAELREMVGKAASFGPLNIAGDLVVGAGIAGRSMSLDGIATSVNTTQSATNSGYGARILEYRRELAETIPELRRYYKGIRMVVA